MASASGIRMGKVFVEIGADASSFFNTVSGLNRRLGSIGRSLSAAGGKLAAVGAAGAAPFGLAARAGARFDSALRDVAASTGATSQQLLQVRSAAMSMSQALSVGPTDAVQGMLELLKAGMPLEQVLGGAGEAALQFAKVGQMAVSDAAVVMADAMKVFGTDANTAANTISAAADASSTSIEQLSIGFSQVGAVAGLANQSIQSTAAALAVMANAGVKGSDAGTSLKTMLLRLMAPADDAAAALDQIGLSTESFRTADGRIKPLIDIIGTLNGALGGMDRAARDDIFRRIFGSDAIRAAAILTDAGVSGFNDMTTAMSGSLTVGAKYETMMGGLAGASQRMMASVERLAIAVGEALAPALTTAMRGLSAAADMVRQYVTENKGLTVAVAAAVAGLATLGTALAAIGLAFTAASTALSGIAMAFLPIGGAAKLIVGVTKHLLFLGVAGASAASQIGGGMVTAARRMLGVVASSTRMAASVANTAIVFASTAASTAASAARIAAAWTATGIAVSAGFVAHIKAMVTYYTGALAGVQAITISRVGATAAAWIKSAAGADTFASAFTASMRTSNRVVTATMARITPALEFVGRGLLALASDAGRLVAPFSRPLVAATGAASEFAASSARHFASYVASVYGAISATTVGSSRIATAWVSQAMAGVSRFASGITSPLAAYATSIATSVSSTVAATARIAGAWISFAMPATAAFATGAVRNIYSYIAASVAASAASVINATRVGAAWVASGLPGLTAFVAGAVAGIGRYLGATALAVASSVASAAAVSAAWLAPLAPFALLGVAIAGVGMLAMRFRDQIGAALGGIGQLAGNAGAAISQTFGDAVSGATVVFGDLAVTATTTFQGIYDAINAGDLAGAMDVLWAGLIAGWNRGVQAIMGPIDAFVTGVQNYFTDLGTGIVIAWDQMVTFLTTNQFAAGILGVFDNLLNGVMATWDTLVANVQKAWIRLTGFISGAKDTKQRIEKIDAENRRRADERGRDRPGVDARRRIAAEEADRIRAQADERQRAALAAADEVKAGRAATNAQRAEARAGATATSNMALGATVAGQAERRTDEGIAKALITELSAATTVDDLANIGQSMSALLERDAIGSETISRVQSAYNQAAQRIFSATATGGGAAAPTGTGRGTNPSDLQAGANAGMRATESVGTFSSAVSGMGFGSSLAQRQLDVLHTIAGHTSHLKTPAEVQH